MNRIVKIFASGDEQQSLSQRFTPIERYPAFILLELPQREVTRLEHEYPLEDITPLFSIPVADRIVDTAPRSGKSGRVHPQAAAAGSKKLPPGPHHYLVQFIGPIKAAWLKAVRAAGAEPREPYRDFTYIVRADDAALKRLAELRFVRWSSHLPHSARIATSVRHPKRAGANTLPRAQVRPGIYTVQFFDAANLKAALPKIKRLGFKVLAQEARARIAVVQSEKSPAQEPAQIDKLATLHGVRTIRERSLPRASNNVAAGIMGTARSLPPAALGLSGAGEIIAVCDTGLDSGSAGTIHPDFSGRITSIMSYPITPDFNAAIRNPGGDDGAADLDSGHGTHVAGSVLGSGVSTPAGSGVTPIRGLAFKAKLVFQAVEQALEWKDPANFQRYGRYLLAGIPLDITTLFGDAYRKGARIHSNSWGGGAPGAYDAQCEQLDRFVWLNKNFCILFAGGNDGTDYDGDGRINAMSVTSPGTAKNCITVGACENVRPQFNSATYGSWWPQDYPVAPYKNDPLANNSNDIVAFSSRGPTRDGRIKPDIVAPGTFILSTRSRYIAANNNAWAPFPQSKLYFYMGGTSMATPLTAGAVGVVREYLRKQGAADPSAALLKASLIAGAVRIGTAAAKQQVFDNDQGYGSVNVDNIVAPVSPLRTAFIDERTGVRTGEAKRYTMTLKANSNLRLVLAYSDYPGPALVNNLNLILISPTGKRYVGNQSSPTSLALDARNNVEVIQVARAAAGKWTIEVVGANVPQVRQDFALVCLGAITGAIVPTGKRR